MKNRKIENPIPYLTEAANAANSYVTARREHLVLSAEIRAKREAKRAAFGMGALIFANLTLFLFFLWITAQIHEAGVSSWVVALISLVGVGAISGALAYMSTKYRTEPHPKHKHEEDANTEPRRTAA